nr:MAG TPA: Protein of unknown function (DUF1043) [Caudoviricetes sp.]
MKYYDKEINKRDESIKTIILILLIFIVSFLIGYKICEFEKNKIIKEKQTKIDEQYVEIDSLRETVYMYQLYEK